MIKKISDLKKKDALKVVIEDFEKLSVSIYKLREEEDEGVLKLLETLCMIGYAREVKEDFIVDLEVIENSMEDFSFAPYFTAFVNKCLKEDIDLLLLLR